MRGVLEALISLLMARTVAVRPGKASAVGESGFAVLVRLPESRIWCQSRSFTKRRMSGLSGNPSCGPRQEPTWIYAVRLFLSGSQRKWRLSATRADAPRLRPVCREMEIWRHGCKRREARPIYAADLKEILADRFCPRRASILAHNAVRLWIPVSKERIQGLAPAW